MGEPSPPSEDAQKSLHDAPPDESAVPPTPPSGGLDPRMVVIAVVAALALLLIGEATPLGRSLVPPPASTPTPDAFHAVRAEAQAAFERGRQYFQREEFDRALIELDQAKLNDPDQRADIERLLQRVVDELRRQSERTPPTTTPQRVSATPTPYTVYLQRGEASPDATAGSSAAPVGSPPPGTQTYQDEERRFSVDFPPAWRPTPRPPAEAGAGVVGFQPSVGKASFVVSVDVLADGISPELYSAHLETNMASLPGYTLEDAGLTIVGGMPAMRRLYSLRPLGASEALRTVQIVVAQRSTMFVLTGTAPASEYGGSSATFEQMVKSFRLMP